VDNASDRLASRWWHAYAASSARAGDQFMVSSFDGFGLVVNRNCAGAASPSSERVGGPVCIDPLPSVPVISALANVVAAVGSTVAVFVTVVFAVRQLRSAQSANHTLVAIELLTRDRSSEEFMRAEDFVLKELTVSYPPPGVSVSDLPTEARHHVTRLAMYYNGLGQMLAFAAVDPRLLMGTGNYRSRQAWRVLEPYILAERAQRGETYLSHFEHLVYMATHNPWAAAVHKLDLKRVDSYPAELGFKESAAPALSRQDGTA
jgi:hypothetical protein